MRYVLAYTIGFAITGALFMVNPAGYSDVIGLGVAHLTGLLFAIDVKIVQHIDSNAVEPSF